MKVYLAHNFAARKWLNNVVVPKITEGGYQVTSRWIWDAKFNDLEDATRDLEDIDSASDFILFVDNFGKCPGRGKFIEMGYALRAGKRITLVGEGDRDSVFYALPNIRSVRTIEEAMILIAGMVKEKGK